MTRSEDRSEPAARPGIQDSGPSPTRTSTDPTLRLAAGALLAGRYRIRRLLGAGGMGLVYEARDEELGVDVAIKVLRPELVGDEQGLERFRRELLVARQVSHPSVVRIHDLGRDGDLCFLTMDLVRGRSLRERLEEGPLDPQRAARVARELAEALAAAHREGIVHRDLKPANVLIDESDRPYVSDFGVARTLGAAGLTRTGDVVGTPDYLAPEQARGEEVDHRADLYALGLVLYELLTGDLPFPGGSYAEVVAQRIAARPRALTGAAYPPRLRAIVARLLQAEPRRRYQSAEEVARDLERFAEPLPFHRRPFVRAAAAGLLGVAALVAMLVVFARRDAAAPPEPAARATTAALAVLPFADETGRPDLAWIGGGLAEMLARGLSESPELHVVDTDRIAQALRDLGLDPARLDAAGRRQLAELFDARLLVTGRVRSLGDEILADLELHELSAGSSDPRPSNATSRAPLSALPDLVAGLDVEVRRLLRVADTPRETPLSARPAALASYSEGVRMLQRGDAVAAAPLLEAAVEADPDFGAAWHELAEARLALGLREPARDAADRAAALLEPTGSRLAWEARAQQAQLRGDSEEMRRILEELLARFPNSLETAVRLAEADGEGGHLKDAIERLERVVEIDPNHPRAWFLLAKYSILAGDSRRAVDEHLVRAMVIQNRLRSAQGRADVLNAFGVAYLDLGDLDRAEEHYRQAAELRREIGDRRGHATTLRNLALVAIYRLDYEQAESLFDEALATLEELGDGAGVADLHNEVGILEEERGRYGEALERYRLALQKRRELGDRRALAESLNNVAYAYSLMGEYDHAEVYWSQALELFLETANREGEAHARQGLGELQLARGDWDDAARSFLAALELARAVESPPAVAAAHGALGQVAQLQGRYAAALAAYDEALVVVRELEDVRGLAEFTLARAESFLELGRFETARELLDQAEPWLEESRNHEQLAELERLRARSLFAGGDDRAGRDALERAIAEARATASPRVLLGVELERATHLPGDESASELTRLLDAASELGSVPLRLRATEALGAELRERRAVDAERVLRSALRIADDAGGLYAGSFRLHGLLAETLIASGRGGEARAVLDAAQAELERVSEGLDRETAGAFERLEVVRRIRQLAASAPEGATPSDTSDPTPSARAASRGREH